MKWRARLPIAAHTACSQGLSPNGCIHLLLSGQLFKSLPQYPRHHTAGDEVMWLGRSILKSPHLLLYLPAIFGTTSMPGHNEFNPLPKDCSNIMPSQKWRGRRSFQTPFSQSENPPPAKSTCLSLTSEPVLLCSDRFYWAPRTS